MTLIQRNNPGIKLSESVAFGDLVFLSGKLPGSTVQDIETQALSLFGIIEESLKRAGSDKSHMLFATIFLKDRSLEGKFNALWNAWLPDGQAPARICVEANMLNDAYLVEIAVTAARSGA
jgi:enamine deaminase RidA (YjgF/YER057c/UK114 family)